MIYDYLFYYIFKFFKLIKNDDDTAAFKVILILSIIAYTNIMILILLVKLSEIVTIQRLEIIHIIVLCLFVLSLLYYRLGYKNKYQLKLKLIERLSTEQKLKYAVLSLIYIAISFILPFVLGIYFGVSM